MIDKLKEIKKQIIEFEIKTSEDLNKFKSCFLVKKGAINEFWLLIKKDVSVDKSVFGKKINEIKSLASEKYQKNIFLLENKSNKTEKDMSLSSHMSSLGGRHPLSKINNKIVSIFNKIGFSIVNDREIEDDWHNFTALNLEENHPARDMQDTFFVTKDKNILLRTHTSSVQVRHMTKNKPPIKIISPGRVFRNETVSYRSNCFFHQIEGLYIDENVSFSDLKKTIDYFIKSFFGEKTKTRFRPSFFPFTEPSAEVDVYWGLESESDYKITKGTGWLEIMGCGMVDPNVLENCNIDSEKYSGFAFGMGIERIAMLKYQINDLRLFFENDLRFLKQFN